MQTQLLQSILDTAEGQAADRILRSCVHCGFCNATCPTYQLLGNELDGPRGRIYLMKQMLEGNAVTSRTQLHLDRCLTCRNCETTCPSGVRYSELLEIGRDMVEQRVARPWHQRLLRLALRRILPYRSRFTPLVRAGQLLRPLLPGKFRRVLPRRQRRVAIPDNQHARSMLMLSGCVQPALAPEINRTTAQVLDRLGIRVIAEPEAGCCGAVSLHLGATEESADFMRRNIDAWWPHIEAGAEAIVITASGCGVTVKDYGRLLAHDPNYAERAARVSAMAKDISEILHVENLDALRQQPPGRQPRIAFHAPCTLQHGMRLGGVTETVLRQLGFELASVPDAHLCCGSAGTYSILQAELSTQLGDNKVAALQSDAPEMIVTANIGCLLELRKRARVPVVHWIELLQH